jgi:hypothetical protein
MQLLVGHTTCKLSLSKNTRLVNFYCRLLSLSLNASLHTPANRGWQFFPPRVSAHGDHKYQIIPAVTRPQTWSGGRAGGRLAPSVGEFQSISVSNKIDCSAAIFHALTREPECINQRIPQ